MLVFNPPYVETYDEEAVDAQSVGVIEKAWAGGVGGMRVTNRMLEVVEVGFTLPLGVSRKELILLRCRTS